MIRRNFFSTLFAENFKGVNCKDSNENIDIGEWDRTSINILSDPQGTLCSRTGFTALTTASIGSATAWCGFAQYDKQSGGSVNSYYIGGGADGKLYNYASNAYSELFSGLTTTKGKDKRYSFFTLDNTVMITCDEDPPMT